MRKLRCRGREGPVRQASCPDLDKTLCLFTVVFSADVIHTPWNPSFSSTDSVRFGALTELCRPEPCLLQSVSVPTEGSLMPGVVTARPSPPATTNFLSVSVHFSRVDTRERNCGVIRKFCLTLWVLFSPGGFKDMAGLRWFRLLTDQSRTSQPGSPDVELVLEDEGRSSL